MIDWLRSQRPTDELGVDPQIAEALGELDPAEVDPNYWLMFRSWVMTDAARELARRRLMADMTVVDVMHSWARAVVPAAVLAAAIAGVLLMRGPVPQAPALEQLLVAEIPGETVPVLLAPEGTEGIVAFASEEF